MIIKKFQGKTEAEATALAKKELGEGAVIMHAKTVKRKGLLGLFKKPYVEVSAALEEESDTSFAKMRAAVSEVAKTINTSEENATSSNTPVGNHINVASPADDYVNRDVENLNNKAFAKSQAVADSANIEEKLDSLHNLLLEKQLIQDHKVNALDNETDARSTDFFKLIYNTLIDNEVDEKYVNDIIDEAVKIYKPNCQIDYILANIYQRMVLKFGKVSLITEAESTGPKVLFFIGPTGVGKTTTIAKLASKLKVNDKKKIALLTTDTYRIAAAEQLKTYANILEVPFKVIYSPDELIESLKDYSECDYILIDTAGHAHNNESQKSGTKQFLSCVSDEYDKQIYLVLSATTKYRDLLTVCETYAEFTDYNLIFTKLDETVALGNLYNIKLRTGANMSYVTYGQDVPDDIDEFSPQTTVKQLLGGKN